MAVITSQQVQNFYDLYKGIDVTFTKDVIKILNFLPEQLFLKILGTQWPCVLYSSSMESAKIILNLKPDQQEKLRTSNTGSLRFGFRISDKNEPLYFFVNVKVRGYSRYSNSANPDVFFMTLEFTQRPNDDMIVILGQFLEANVNSHKRKDERVSVNEQLIKKIGFASCSTLITVENIDRKCIVRDLSFGGTKVLIPGVAKFLEGRKATLKLTLEESGEVLSMPGSLIRVAPLEGRRDITQASMEFDEGSVPMPYKMRLNDFLKHLSKLGGNKQPPAGTPNPSAGGGSGGGTPAGNSPAGGPPVGGNGAPSAPKA